MFLRDRKLGVLFSHPLEELCDLRFKLNKNMLRLGFLFRGIYAEGDIEGTEFE